ncbi:TnsA-like heteromeric transposase endonuclease subunit [Dactylosporangium sp. NPDC051485]|uniref:TnsA-like heteromeric transposase endonuclease subunit n=1 Tax=Dactylosporangium sp. NPDC051485 TaxID=3154846 RepID=UPI0034367883
MSHRRRRGFPGLWWFSASGEHVGFESWLERDQVMALDADPGVAAVASQPFGLSWTAGGRRVRHAPDFFARLFDGTGVVIDVRDEAQIQPAAPQPAPDAG